MIPHSRVTIVVSRILGGILWVLHDMQAGYFTTGARFWSDVWWGATEGLTVGWLVIATSIPYNLLGFALGVACLNHLPKFVAAITKRERPRNDQDGSDQPVNTLESKAE